MRLGRFAAAVTLVIAVVVACGGAASGSPVPTNQVNLPKSYRFDPPDISVAKGTTVSWTNNDNFPHSVQFLDGGLPTQPLMMQPGEGTTFTFSTPGTYHYQCSIHPQTMKGSVVVTP
jgi:plastocyanin